VLRLGDVGWCDLGGPERVASMFPPDSAPAWMAEWRRASAAKVQGRVDPILRAASTKCCSGGQPVTRASDNPRDICRTRCSERRAIRRETDASHLVQALRVALHVAHRGKAPKEFGDQLMRLVQRADARCRRIKGW